MTKSVPPRAGHTCMICNFAPTTKNKYRELQDHLVRKHFADRIKAALPTKRPYICPEPGCRLEGKDWQALMRHYTGKHNVLESFLKEVIQSGTVSLPSPIRKNVHYNKLSGLSNSALKQSKTNHNNNSIKNNNNDIVGPGGTVIKSGVKRKRASSNNKRSKQRPPNLSDLESKFGLNGQPILTMLPLEPLSPSAAAAAGTTTTQPPPSVARMMTVANLSEEQSQQLALVLKRPKANGEETVAFIDLRSFLASSTYIANPSEALKCVDSHLNVLAMPAANNAAAEYGGEGSVLNGGDVYTETTAPELLRPQEQHLVLNALPTSMENFTGSEQELTFANVQPNEWVNQNAQFIVPERNINSVELVEQQQQQQTPLQLVVPQNLDASQLTYTTTTTALTSATLPPMVQNASVLAAPDAPLELLEGDDGFFYLATPDGQHLQIPVVNSVQVQSPTGEPMQVIQLGSQLGDKGEMEQPLVLHSIAPEEENKAVEPQVQSEVSVEHVEHVETESVVVNEDVKPEIKMEEINVETTAIPVATTAIPTATTTLEVMTTSSATVIESSSTATTTTTTTSSSEGSKEIDFSMF